MSLYRMELYKILHRKSVLITGMLMILWMTFYFFMQRLMASTIMAGRQYKRTGRSLQNTKAFSQMKQPLPSLQDMDSHVK